MYNIPMQMMMMIKKETIYVANRMHVSHAFCCRFIPMCGRNVDVVVATHNVFVLAARRRHSADVVVLARRTVG
jgi:hypothetical protein